MSIKGTGCKFGGCVRKAVELTWGDPPFDPESRLRVERSILTGRQTSAAGVVVRQRMKAQTVLRKEGNGSGEQAARLMGDKRQKTQLVLLRYIGNILV